MNVTTEQLYTDARTQNGWRDTPVSDEQLHQLYDLLKWGPTSANCSPARFIFVRGQEAKDRLVACMGEKNQPKTAAAPVTVIIGMDMSFYDKLPKLFPHTDAKSWFVDKPKLISDTAFRNSSLQGGYLILAARAIGLDCGPMSGFDADKLDEAFWKGTSVRTNFVCSLGQGDPSKVMPRSPRLAFDEACQVA